MGEVHFYTRPWQPFSRYREVDGHVVAHNPRAVFVCGQCRDRRWAKHLTIQVFYDLVRIRCADGCYGQRGRDWELEG